MVIIKIIGVSGTSENSFDDAINKILKQAAETVQNIKSIYVKEMNDNVGDTKIVSYGVNAKDLF